MRPRLLEIIHVNDTPNLVFTFLDPFATQRTVLDISTYTSLEAKLRKPNGVVLTRTAAFVTDGTDGKTSYQVIPLELDSSGWWEFWGIVAGGSLNFRTNSIRHEVMPLGE